MSDILNKTIVLVLNRNWQAINVRTPQEAFCMMATNVATALEIEGENHIRPVTWDEWITLPIRDGDNLVLIASVGGAPHHPGWYHNLQGGEAEVQVGSERRRVRARDAEGEERERLWAQMVALYPNYAEYQKKTSRQIPVVVLEPS